MQGVSPQQGIKMPAKSALQRAHLAAERLDRELVSTRSLKRGWELRSAEDRHGLRALSRINVSAVAVGKKVVDGQVTDQDVVNFYVHRKLPLTLIDKGFKLPKTVAGMPTDVIESSPIQFGSPTAAPSAILNGGSRHRPISGGMPHGRADGGGGTLGMMVVSTAPDTRDQAQILGSGHVFTSWGTVKNATLIQPQISKQGSSPRDDIGTVIRSNTWTSGTAADNKYDAALATLDADAMSGFPADPNIDPRIIGPAFNGQSVRIYGAVHKLATGVIESVTYPARYSSPLDGRVYAFAGSIRIKPHAGEVLTEGDSGAIVLNENKTEAVAVLMAVQSGYWIASPLLRISEDWKFTL